MIQKGLLIIVFKDNKSQLEVLQKQFWVIGQTSFKALKWSSDAVNEEILALSCPRWLLIKNPPPSFFGIPFCNC